MSGSDTGVVRLDVEECRHLLRTHNLGRLAVLGAERVEIFPVNYLLYGPDVYLRTAPGAKLAALQDRADVAFEIDGRGRRKVWSVVVHGTARHLAGGALSRRSGVAELATDLPGVKTHYVRIVTGEVTGRSFVGEPRPWNIVPIVVVGVIVVAIVAALGVLGNVFSIG
jgi:nitroimidazol reductase NimA-like FMN-containing flavoprotein (pyridoxamine 5'-phosphate oxidase superfamily)